MDMVLETCFGGDIDSVRFMAGLDLKDLFQLKRFYKSMKYKKEESISIPWLTKYCLTRFMVSEYKSVSVIELSSIK